MMAELPMLWVCVANTSQDAEGGIGQRKMRCFNCNAEGLKPHDNWPATRILINPQTETPHVCDRRDIIIKQGKWRGFSFREAAEINDHVNKTHLKYLASLRELFRSPYE